MQYFEIEISIAIDQRTGVDGFSFKRISNGYNKLEQKNGTWKLTPIVDEQGNPYNLPQPLNANGGVIAPTSSATEKTYYYIDIYPYQSISYEPLTTLINAWGK